MRNEDIHTAAARVPDATADNRRRLVPMQIGRATVFIEYRGEAIVADDDRIQPVAPSAGMSFESAGDIVRECISVLGSKIESLADSTKLEEVRVEFSLSFQVKGKASLIPVLITGETTAESGLKVSALWKSKPAAKNVD